MPVSHHTATFQCKRHHCWSPVIEKAWQSIVSYEVVTSAAVCKRLNEQASVPVKFSFFPENEVFFDGLAPAIKAQVPDAKPYSTSTIGHSGRVCRCSWPWRRSRLEIPTARLTPSIRFANRRPFWRYPATDKMVLETAIQTG